MMVMMVMVVMVMVYSIRLAGRKDKAALSTNTYTTPCDNRSEECTIGIGVVRDVD